MIKALKSHEFNFKGQTSVYHGKVRDVYSLSDGRLIMVASDRISAFDHILPRPIPFKGQVLNQVATYFFKGHGRSSTKLVACYPRCQCFCWHCMRTDSSGNGDPRIFGRTCRENV